MKVRFWGVRGSIGTNPSHHDIRNKIEVALNDAIQSGVKSPEDVSDFLNKRYEQYPTVFGGHTTCISVETSQGNIVIDAGTGIRKFATWTFNNPEAIKNNTLPILLTHHHWDHISGFPFFIPAFNPNMNISIYHPEYDVKKPETYKFLSKQQSDPFFPVMFNDLPSKIDFHNIKDFDFGGVKIEFLKLHHPQVSYSYKITDQGKTMVFMTDTEVTNLNQEEQKLYLDFLDGSDVAIVDSQYDFKETFDKLYWGHSSIFAFIDIAKKCEVKKLYMFHYDPESSDEHIIGLHKRAQQYIEKVKKKTNFEVFTSHEGLCVEI